MKADQKKSIRCRSFLSAHISNLATKQMVYAQHVTKTITMCGPFSFL